MLNNAMIELMGVSLWETLYMVMISMVLSYAIGIPIGVVINITSKDGICPNRAVNAVLGVIVNIFPFHTFPDLADMDAACYTGHRGNYGWPYIGNRAVGSICRAVRRKNGGIIVERN